MEKGVETVPGGDKRQKNTRVERNLLELTQRNHYTYSHPVLTDLARQG